MGRRRRMRRLRVRGPSLGAGRGAGSIRSNISGMRTRVRLLERNFNTLAAAFARRRRFRNKSWR